MLNGIRTILYVGLRWEVQLFSPRYWKNFDAHAHISGSEETTHNCICTVWGLQRFILLTQQPEPLESLFLKGFSYKLFDVLETATNCDGYKSQLATVRGSDLLKINTSI